MPREETNARGGAELAASRRQLGLLWGAVSVVLLLALPHSRQLAQALPTCAFRAVIGLPCPTCGLTRATLALADLDFVAALQINPLATILSVAFVVGGLIAGLSALGGRPLREPGWVLGSVVWLGVFVVEVLLVIADENGQRIGDRLAKTAVIDLKP